MTKCDRGGGEGEGVKNCPNLCDVIYERSLSWIVFYFVVFSDIWNRKIKHYDDGRERQFVVYFDPNACIRMVEND